MKSSILISVVILSVLFQSSLQGQLNRNQVSQNLQQGLNSLAGQGNTLSNAAQTAVGQAATVTPTAIPTAIPTITPTAIPTATPTTTAAAAAAAASSTTYLFYQGLDSHSDDIKLISGQSVDQLKAACTADPACLGFNTIGYLKKVLLPQTQWFKWSDKPADGIYVKNGVVAPASKYNFYQGLDSHAGDINQIPLQGRTADQLKAACDSDKTCVAFNTIGFFKKTQLPKTQWFQWSNDTKEGLYVKAASDTIATSQYTFSKGLDSFGGDINRARIAGQTVDQLKAFCATDPSCVGFNTDGWFKSSLLPQDQWFKWTEDANLGIYTKQQKSSFISKRDNLRAQNSLYA